MLNFAALPASTSSKPEATEPKRESVEVTATAAVVQTIEMQPVPLRASASSDRMVSADNWGWRELRDYVVREIEVRHGPQPRDFGRERGIFDGFCRRWGKDAAKIARTAFEVHDGMWRNAPISISRFAKGSDPYFAQVIAKNFATQQ